MWATKYILKEYNINNSCFYMVTPNKELFNGIVRADQEL